MTERVRPCLVSPPPSEAIGTVFTAEGGCPSQFVYCIKESTAEAIQTEMRLRRKWDAEAWELCRP